MMNSLKKQQGMATILLVLLIGLTVMIITSTVAKSLVSNKEANVAAHAQTNVQLMGWAGVSAFREYLLKKYKDTDILEFKQNLIAKSSIDLLIDEATNQYIRATDFDVQGCIGFTEEVNNIPGTKCLVTATITSESGSANAATSIRVIYDLKTDIIKYLSQINFAGSTHFTGASSIEGELGPDGKLPHVVLNVDGGNLSIQAGFKLINVGELTLNVTKRYSLDRYGNKKYDRNGNPIYEGGDVIIDCSIRATKGCGIDGNNTRININAQGNVHIIHPGHSDSSFGDIQAEGWVKLQSYAKAQNIKALGNVELALGSTAQKIYTAGNVTLTESSSATEIFSNGNVTLRTNVKTKGIETLGSVSVYANSIVDGSILSGGSVNLSSSRVNGDVKAYNYVDLDTNSTITGSVYAHNITPSTSNKPIDLDNPSTYKKGGVGTFDSAVRLSTSWIGGNVYANGNLRLLDGLIGEDVKGNVYLTGEILYLKGSISGSEKKEKLTLDQLPKTPGFPIKENPEVNKLIKSFSEDSYKDNYKFNTDLTYVDVTQYKNDANYIFTRNNGVARVYLNKLKNENTQIEYEFKDGKQYYKPTLNGESKLLNEDGFYLGKYTANGKKYTGAICLEVNESNEKKHRFTNSSGIFSGLNHKSGYCKSEIVGYLPRMSVEFSGEFISPVDNLSVFGFPADYDFTLEQTWYIRSSQHSGDQKFVNPAFAPGIFYFEGDLQISGLLTTQYSKNSDGEVKDSLFTNTFLAEGDINAIAFSPRIYSPRNTRRLESSILANPDALICSRNLITVTNTEYKDSAPSTTPLTLSNKYLTPINLCANGKLKNSMVRNPITGDIDKIQIQVKDGSDKGLDGKIIQKYKTITTDKTDLSFVALMSNRIIRIGTCARIYGDVLAKSTIEGSAACPSGYDNGIHGQVGSEGVAPYIDGIEQINTMGSGSKIVVPKNEFKNLNKLDADPTKDHYIAIKNADLQWAKYQ